MRNGWLPIRLAKHMNCTGYLTEDVPKVMLWVRGHGCYFGNIYETEQGLLVRIHGMNTGKVDGFQPCPRGPRSRR